MIMDPGYFVELVSTEEADLIIQTRFLTPRIRGAHESVQTGGAEAVTSHLLE